MEVGFRRQAIWAAAAAHLLDRQIEPAHVAQVLALAHLILGNAEYAADPEAWAGMRWSKEPRMPFAASALGAAGAMVG